MQSRESTVGLDTQNSRLGIRMVAPGFGALAPELAATYGLTHRKPYYFLLFMVEGRSRHGVDLQQFEVKAGELLFVLPHQIHRLPGGAHGVDFFKLGFDEACLSMLPRQYPFLINPFNNQKLRFPPAAAERLRGVFQLLRSLLGSRDSDPELILAYLNSVLTEINAGYFCADKNPADERLSKYIEFKLLVEDQYADHPTIEAIAEKLALNTNSLYAIVKHYSGVSPKTFVGNRLILEAKRRLYYSELTTIKELAYALGFNDPEYFARLFKKVVGKSVTAFVQDLSGN